jgi:hypothetical protein
MWDTVGVAFTLLVMGQWMWCCAAISRGSLSVCCWPAGRDVGTRFVYVNWQSCGGEACVRLSGSLGSCKGL